MYHLLRFLRVHVFSFECRSIDRVTLSSLFALMSDYDFVDRVVDVTSRYPRVDNRYVSSSITSICTCRRKDSRLYNIFIYIYIYTCTFINIHRVSSSPFWKPIEKGFHSHFLVLFFASFLSIFFFSFFFIYLLKRERNDSQRRWKKLEKFLRPFVCMHLLSKDLPEVSIRTYFCFTCKFYLPLKIVRTL